MNAPPLADAADIAEVERIVRAAGTSFHRGMRILPPDRRAAMYAIYAFCRIVDDIADAPAPERAQAAARHAALAEWRGRIGALYRGTPAPAHAVDRVLEAAIGRFTLREADFVAIIDGMQMDADHRIVAPTLAELDLYCDRVASAVGRLSVRAFGDASPAADEVAHALGRALQYTNILRDLDEDAARQRLYLPAEYLLAAGIAPDPQAALADPRLGEVCDRLAGDARALFSRADAAMARCDRTAMKPARLMASGYRAILHALLRRGWRRLAEPPRIGVLAKLGIALRAALPA